MMVMKIDKQVNNIMKKCSLLVFHHHILSSVTFFHQMGNDNDNYEYTN